MKTVNHFFLLNTPSQDNTQLCQVWLKTVERFRRYRLEKMDMRPDGQMERLDRWTDGKTRQMDSWRDKTDGQ